MALDVGTKRMGAAFVDTTIGVVLPVGVVPMEEATISSEIFKTLVGNFHPDKFIIGVPHTLTGSESTEAARIKERVTPLVSAFDIPYEWVDERFTTRLAVAHGGTVSRDERAAMSMLEDYVVAIK